MDGAGIRTVDEDGINGIISFAKPAGYWMARSTKSSMQWIGVVADGETTVRQYGAFAEVLSWLYEQAGIRPKQGSTSPSREKRYDKQTSLAWPLRIEGAEIQDWKEGSADAVTGRRTYTLSPEKNAEIMERDRRIAELYADGVSYAGIAEAVGCVISTVHLAVQRMKEAGELNVVGRRRSQEQIAENERRMVDLLWEGRSLKDIARAIGQTPQHVSYKIANLRDRGVELPPTIKEQQQARWAEIRRLHAEGLTDEEIAEAVGCSVKTVRVRIKEDGL